MHALEAQKFKYEEEIKVLEAKLFIKKNNLKKHIDLMKSLSEIEDKYSYLKNVDPQNLTRDMFITREPSEEEERMIDKLLQLNDKQPVTQKRQNTRLHKTPYSPSSHSIRSNPPPQNLKRQRRNKISCSIPQRRCHSEGPSPSNYLHKTRKQTSPKLFGTKTQAFEDLGNYFREEINELSKRKSSDKRKPSPPKNNHQRKLSARQNKSRSNYLSHKRKYQNEDMGQPLIEEKDSEESLAEECIYQYEEPEEEELEEEEEMEEEEELEEEEEMEEEEELEEEELEEEEDEEEMETFHNEISEEDIIITNQELSLKDKIVKCAPKVAKVAAVGCCF